MAFLTFWIIWLISVEVKLVLSTTGVNVVGLFKVAFWYTSKSPATLVLVPLSTKDNVAVPSSAITLPALVSATDGLSFLIAVKTACFSSDVKCFLSATTVLFGNFKIVWSVVNVAVFPLSSVNETLPSLLTWAVKPLLAASVADFTLACSESLKV